MPRKIEAPIIDTVEFYYAGSDKQFNDFLKAVVREYIVDDKLLPDDEQTDSQTA